MTDAYESLVSTGFVGSLKRDILLEASRDLEYIGTIRHAFREAGQEAKKHATACAVRLIEELLAAGLCTFATWASDPPHEPKRIEPTHVELVEMVDRSVSPESHPFEFFLLATEAGDEWVARYLKLVDEL